MKQRVLTGSEAQEQERLFEWAAYQSARLPGIELMYHVPNGGKRDKREAQALKRRGVKAGVPDICLPVPKKGYHGFYIELKAGKQKGRVSEGQYYWMHELGKQGYKVAICYSGSGAAEEIEKYLTDQEGDNEL